MEGRSCLHGLAVWDTVGSLGIPNVSFLSKLGLHQSTKEFRFFDTNLSDRIEYAFQALALDEHRLPFSPTVWERTLDNRKSTDLRQVWFPGNHGNVGGGWQDAGVANMSLACRFDTPGPRQKLTTVCSRDDGSAGIHWG